jgi:hypothetical protein
MFFFNFINLFFEILAAGDVLNLSFALQALFLPPDSPTQLQSSSRILTLGRYLRNAGKVRWVGIRDVNQGVDEEEDIVQMVQSSPRASTRRTARRLHVR